MEIIGIELFQELTIAMQFYKPENKIDTTPEALKEVPSTIVADFKELLEEARFSDAEFLFANPQSKESTRFHRAIVAAHSKPLFQLISTSKTKQITMEGLNDTAVNDLLEYIYYGEDNFNPLGACQLVEHTINQYALQHMLDDCISSISDGITDQGSLKILRVTYLPNFEAGAPMRELREKALNHICRQFKSISIPDVRSVQPPAIAYAMTADLLDKIYADYPMEGPDPNAGDRKKSTTRKKKTHKSKTPRTEGRRQSSARDLKAEAKDLSASADA